MALFDCLQLDSGKLSYSFDLMNSTASSGEYFSVQSSTGAIRVKKGLYLQPANQTRLFSIRVRVRDNGIKLFYNQDFTTVNVELLILFPDIRLELRGFLGADHSLSQ